MQLLDQVEAELEGTEAATDQPPDQAPELPTPTSLNGVVSVERVGERSFVIRADRKGWLTNFFAAIFRAAGPAGIREVYERDLLTATVVEKTADGRDLLVVRFRLDRPLADPDLLYLQWDG